MASQAIRQMYFVNVYAMNFDNDAKCKKIKKKRRRKCDQRPLSY